MSVMWTQFWYALTKTVDQSPTHSITPSHALTLTCIGHLSLSLSRTIAYTLTHTPMHQMWTSVRPTMAIATANAHAPTRRVVAPVRTARVVGPTREIQNTKVGVVWMALTCIIAVSQLI